MDSLNIYENVDITEQQQAQTILKKRQHPSTQSDVCHKEKPTQNTDPAESRSTAKKLPCPDQTPQCRHRLLLLLSGLLVALLLLFLALFTVGFVKYSAIKEELQQAQLQNQLLRNSVSSPFLIYNEDHNRCVAVEHPDAVKTMPCDPHNSTQQFQWLSKGRLLHVALKLCLGVLDKSSWQALQLHPCKAGSDLQQWECQDDKLFAMKGSELYFNYGNNERDVVILYNGTGPWSRWVIYGSRDDLCSWSCDVCLPCRKGWSFYQGHCYYFSRSSVTWEDANKSCVSQESNLLIIDSQKEQVYIQEKLDDRGFWIGLTRGEEWKWLDGSSILPSTSSWGLKQPDNKEDEKCVSMIDFGKWHDYPCEHQFYWICEKVA
uniref:Macrophage mannose receptor 1-like isoform X2 n=1 Tax=Geotrypetes seraphini TaxID=260995 RepID=A0A6P8P5P0_GEOSA|nr:macrophage mannose receptor 1-like isoform X2 [Geotrypetes seraphini]